ARVRYRPAAQRPHHSATVRSGSQASASHPATSRRMVRMLSGSSTSVIALSRSRPTRPRPHNVTAYLLRDARIDKRRFVDPRDGMYDRGRLESVLFERSGFLNGSPPRRREGMFGCDLES